jgi:hypothetical protein
MSRPRAYELFYDVGCQVHIIIMRVVYFLCLHKVGQNNRDASMLSKRQLWSRPSEVRGTVDRTTCAREWCALTRESKTSSFTVVCGVSQSSSTLGNAHAVRPTVK